MVKGAGSRVVKPARISREVLEGYRRQRVVVALAELTHEGGVADLTTTRIIGRARMARNTFYELFDGKAECMEFACRRAGEGLVGPMEEACEEAGSWRDRLDRTIGALLRTAAAEPLLAELCLIHSPAVEANGTAPSSQRPVEALVAAMAGACEAPSEREELVASAVVSVVASRIRRGEAEGLSGLHGELNRLATKLLD